MNTVDDDFISFGAPVMEVRGNGEIYIYKAKDHVIINTFNLSFIKASIEKRLAVIDPGYDSSIAIKLFRRYIKHEGDPIIKWTPDSDHYKVTDLTKVVQEVKRFLKNDIPIPRFKLNERLYFSSIELLKSHPNDVKYKRKAFKLEMSKKYKAFLFRDSPVHFLQEFRFLKSEKRFDLVDPFKKIIYITFYSGDSIYSSLTKPTVNQDVLFDKLDMSSHGWKLIVLFAGNRSNLSFRAKTFINSHTTIFEDY